MAVQTSLEISMCNSVYVSACVCVCVCVCVRERERIIPFHFAVQTSLEFSIFICLCAII